MKIYQIEVGAIYWVTAHNPIQAFETLRSSWEADGCLVTMAEAESIHVDELDENQAREMKLQMDDEVASQRLLWDLARDVTKPSVLACSDWP